MPIKGIATAARQKGSKQMSTQWTSPELQTVVDELLRRTAVDQEFRKLALINAEAAFGQIVPKPLPDGMTFRFVDNEGPVKTIPIS